MSENFICIYCNEKLVIHGDYLKCSTCNCIYPIKNGIIDFLPSENRRRYDNLDMMELAQTISNYDKIHDSELFNIPDELVEAVKLADLHPRNKVIDVGCGIGILFKLLPEDIIGTALDISQVALTKVKDIYRNVETVRAMGELIPYSDNYFDILFCMGSLEHFLSIEKGVKEFYRVLKPEGQAIILIPQRNFLLKNAIYHYFYPNFHPLNFLKRLYFRLLEFRHLHVQTRDHYFDFEEARMLFEDNGFIAEEARKVPLNIHPLLTYDFLFKLKKV